MTRLTWDAVGVRTYQAGLDRGVLYFPWGTAVAWNGLTGVDVDNQASADPAYLDGRKYLDRDIYGTFVGKLRAFTYPDDFSYVGDVKNFGGGLMIHDQKPHPFGLSFRTPVSNDLGPVGYQIHILYNLLAVADPIAYNSVASSVDPVEFAWTLAATPEKVSGFRPTVHAIIDSTEIPSQLLTQLETILYGSSSVNPSLPSLEYLKQLAVYAGAITITDNGDGTWTAAGPDTNVYLLSGDPTQFQIDGVNATVIDANTYQVSTTVL